MQGITVKELYESCKAQVEKGNGNKLVLISSDDEGNDFHTLYYLFQDDVEKIKEWVSDPFRNFDDVVLLG